MSPGEGWQVDATNLGPTEVPCPICGQPLERWRFADEVDMPYSELLYCPVSGFYRPIEPRATAPGAS